MPETRQPQRPDANAARTSTAARAPSKGPGLVTVLSQRRLVIVLVLYFCTFLYMTTMQVALALLGKERLGWNESQVGNVFALFGVIMLVTQGGLIGWIARTLGLVRVVATGSMISAAGLTTIALAYHFWPLIAGLLLLALGLGVTQPMLSSLASEYAGTEQRGAVLGFAQSAGGLARTVGPVSAAISSKASGPAHPSRGARSRRRSRSS